MNRMSFIKSIKSEKDLDNHFDEIMSMYNLLSLYDLNDVKYKNISDSLHFYVYLSSIDKAKMMKDFMSNSQIHNYGQTYDINLVQNKNMLNINLVNNKISE